MNSNYYQYYLGPVIHVKTGPPSLGDHCPEAVENARSELAMLGASLGVVAPCYQAGAACQDTCDAFPANATS